jgi:hypothetical protein
MLVPLRIRRLARTPSFAEHTSYHYLSYCTLTSLSAEDLDEAIIDRCDESLLFPLPDKEGRCSLLDVYYRQHVKRVAEQHNRRANAPWARFKNNFSLSSWRRNQHPHLLNLDPTILVGSHLEEVARALRGFSGREISKLMVALQSALYASDDDNDNGNGNDNGNDGTGMMLTKEQVWQLVSIKAREHEEKKLMIRAPLSVTYEVEDEDDRGVEEMQGQVGTGPSSDPLTARAAPQAKVVPDSGGHRPEASAFEGRTIMDQGRVSSSGSGPLPKAARRVSVANEVVLDTIPEVVDTIPEVADTIPDRVASVLDIDKYHIALDDGTNDKNCCTSNLFSKHEIIEHRESLP